jgi:hypothetical protein
MRPMILCNHCTGLANFSAITGGMTRFERKTNHRHARHLWFSFCSQNLTPLPLERRAIPCRRFRGIQVAMFRCRTEKALSAVAILCKRYTKVVPLFAMNAVMEIAARVQKATLKVVRVSHKHRRFFRYNNRMNKHEEQNETPPPVLIGVSGQHANYDGQFYKQTLWRFHHSPDVKKSQFSSENEQ